MKLFHITSNLNAEAILKEGFRTTTGYYFTDRDWTGFATRFANNIRLFSKPWKGEGGFDDGILFSIEIPENIINEFELVEKGNAIREFLAPATLLNCYEPVVVTDDY